MRSLRGRWVKFVWRRLGPNGAGHPVFASDEPDVPEEAPLPPQKLVACREGTDEA